MTYKEKFAASQDKAHYHNIATKILRDLTDLRSKVENSPTAPRRWIWELIQNAKDVHPEGGVKIQVEFEVDSTTPFVAFKHNGKPFTADNIRFLIEQISTKDRKKDEEGKRKTTGKFGTGFLTTHLLSEIVTIEAVAKEPELNYCKFVLKLDRSGYDPDEITEAVHVAKKSVEDLDSRPHYLEYIEGEFNTVFRYPLSDPVSLKVARWGYDDLESCLPYCLVFVNEIEGVEILPSKDIYQFNGISKQLTDSIKIVSVKIRKENKNFIFKAVVLNKGLTSILTPIKEENNSITLLPITDTIPRLFCDFPLIGTEKFPFPVIVNNPHFNPTDPRDGVYLTSSQRANPQSDENKIIIAEAIELYSELLEYASSNNWKNLHVLAQIHQSNEILEWMDDVWFKKDVIEPIRSKLLSVKIVDTVDNSLISIVHDGSKHAWFPTASKKEIRDRIWTSAHFWFPHLLPKHSDVETWNKLIWNECGKLTVQQLSAFVEGRKTISSLKEVLKGIDVYAWLNDFYEVLKLEEKEYDAVINKRLIFPNQNGDFCLKGKLKKDAGNIADDFKDILKLLGNDIRSQLIDEKINLVFTSDDNKDQAYAVREIISEVTEKTKDREVAKGYIEAFKKILVWFNTNPTQAEILFSTLFHNKHLLYDDEEIMLNINKAVQLDDLLSEFDANDIDELRKLFTKNKNDGNGLLTVTQDILVSMGITSIDEWKEALKDKNLAELFSHESIPTTDMFFYAQGLISKAKESIKAHLATLEKYDLQELDETAPTILAGIIKDGQPLSIVARPAYGGEVIIYYGSEQNVLDYEPSELWVDDGKQVRRISLGHILKKGQIIKFPI